MSSTEDGFFQCKSTSTINEIDTVVSKSASKRTFYTVDPYHQDALRDAQSVLGADFLQVLDSIGGLLFKPEAIVGRRIRSSLKFLAERGFVPIAYRKLGLSRLMVSELWRYQRNAYTSDRIDFMEYWRTSAPGLYVLFRDIHATQFDLSARGSERLTALKGHANPDRQSPADLRAHLKQTLTLLNFVHTSDETSDLLRDIAILFEQSDRNWMFRRCSNGGDVSAALDAEISKIEEPYRFNSLDPTESLQRLSAVINARHGLDANLVKRFNAWTNKPESVRAESVRHWLDLAVEIPASLVEKFDLVTIWAANTKAARKGRSALIPSALVGRTNSSPIGTEYHATARIEEFPVPEEKISGKPLPEVFFIAAMSKSGTTWLQQLLNGHPSMVCRGEGHFGDVLLPRLVEAMESYNASSRWRNVATKYFDCPEFREADIVEPLREIVRNCFLRWISASGKSEISHIGEKTPENAFFLDLLCRTLFPGAKVIHIVRDVRDAAASGWSERLRTRPEDTLIRYGSIEGYLRIFAQRWLDTILACHDFRDRFPNQYLEVKYEDLYSAETTETLRILNFLKVDTSSESLAAVQEAGAFERLAGGRARGDVCKDSFFRIGEPGTWQDVIDPQYELIFDECAGSMMLELGYIDGSAAHAKRRELK